ncbi:MULTISPECIES: RHS repeat-associated core domain-containing protein [unclassified Pseudomonas]|uniref:RHS repeat-associated core domain-containing protein n=1 Tax=unclassified Pseudomonas TaxID=196821 RepID=UPI000CD1BBDA|nr:MULTISPECIES: RHS repeat-associated core domain-containing protein [unclassified Pseudomonas]POA51998.1 type IV secretion protein Rhs [Pseudomonas sp. FW507-12TSA]
MSDALWAARLGDGLEHTSMMADILGGVLEVAANVAIGTLATMAVAAAAGITVATGGLGACVLGLVVGVVVGVVMSKTGADKGLSSLCEDIGNALFPPSIQATIASGSKKVLTNNKPAARAAGIAPPSQINGDGAEEGEATDTPSATPEEGPGFLDMATEFFSQMWRPTVASPAPGSQPKDLDQVTCTKHPPMPLQYLAEGSEKVSIDGQPAVRSGDRSTCDAKVVSAGPISPDVTIGGGSVVVREIRSGKTPGVGLAVTVLMMLKGGKGKFKANLPCMLMAGVNSFVVSQATNALTQAVAGSPNPVHAATGAKVLGGEDDLDFVLPGMLPIAWQRFYNSRDERQDGLFGTGWSVPFEVNVQIETHPEGGERLLYTDEQGRQIDMGSIAPGGAMFSPGTGLSVRRNTDGRLLIESSDGVYRLFEPSPGNPLRLRLGLLGDRNDNRIHLDYDPSGRITRLRDSFDLLQVELIPSNQWPGRLARIERLHADQQREVLASYDYDTQGNLAQVRDASGQISRHFAYDPQQRMVEHQLPTGLRCFYAWDRVDEREWRVVRHWTDAGDEYHFDYDLQAGITRITDGLQRQSLRKWNTQHQITEYQDKLGHVWRFQWNEERQLLGATDPLGGQYQYSYDETGNLCSHVDPLGRNESTLWLEHWSLPLTETDAAGNSWNYQYDKSGNCIGETDPLGNTTRYRYDNHGRVVEIIDAGGKRKQLTWNDLGQLLKYVDCSGYPTRFSYDRHGYLQVATDALGERQAFEHDPQGRLLSIQLADGRIERYQRNTAGQLLCYTDPAGHSSRYEYDRRGKLQLRIDAHGRRVHFNYDNYGRLQTLTNENAESYRFTWDAADRLLEQRDLDGSARRFAYDPMDNAVRMEFAPAPQDDDPASPPSTPIVHLFERDAVGRMLAKVTDDGRSEYLYDPLNQLLGVTFTDGHGQSRSLGFTYDALGQLLKEQSAAGQLRHHYDELGNLTQTQLADGRWINRLYYGSGHLHQINLDGQLISDFERDRLHREVLRTQGRISTHSEYDRTGRLRSRMRRPTGQQQLLSASRERQFAYDPANQLVGRIDRLPQGEHRQLLHYDATGRIIASQDSPQGTSETFAYDAAANLLDSPQAGAGLVVHNKLLTYQDKRYRYDAFGRVVEKRSGSRRIQHLRYDAEHRLVEVRTRDGARETLVRMGYDPLGRRTEKIELDSQGQLLNETHFTWNGLRLLQERKNGLSSLYLYADEGHEVLARVDGIGAQQKVRYYHNDLNGLPEQLTEADGHVLWQARYRVWGNCLEEQREAHFLEEQNLRFQGQYLDRETGLHYNTLRFYDPDIGRFTTPDPIGLEGGFNLYLYGPNTATWIDPLGLTAEELGKNMANAGRPLAPGQTPHHAVKENATNIYAKNSRKILEDAKLHPDIPENGARLWGTHPNQLAQPGHPGKDAAKAAGNYHGGTHIHGKENDKLLYKILKSAKRKNLNMRNVLANITGRMENGSWKKSFNACGGK